MEAIREQNPAKANMELLHMVKCNETVKELNVLFAGKPSVDMKLVGYLSCEYNFILGFRFLF
jgi:hypothetical protein